MHKIDGAHLQYVNNLCAKFEYKGMNTVGVTDYTNLAPKVLRTDGRNGPTTRPTFAKAMQIQILFRFSGKIYISMHFERRNAF